MEDKSDSTESDGQNFLYVEIEEVRLHREFLLQGAEIAELEESSQHTG